MIVKSDWTHDGEEQMGSCLQSLLEFFEPAAELLLSCQPADSEIYCLTGA